MLDTKRRLYSLMAAGAVGLSILALSLTVGAVSADGDEASSYKCAEDVERNAYFDGHQLSESDLNEEQLANANEPEFQRVGYFDGKFLTASDLQSEQAYLIAFEHGEIRNPYIIGQLFNSQEAPPKQKC